MARTNNDRFEQIEDDIGSLRAAVSDMAEFRNEIRTAVSNHQQETRQLIEETRQHFQQETRQLFQEELHNVIVGLQAVRGPPEPRRGQISESPHIAESGVANPGQCAETSFANEEICQRGWESGNPAGQGGGWRARGENPAGQSGGWRARKLDLPSFDGENPDEWVLRAEHYFEFYKLSEEKKIEAAVVSLDGEALLLYRWKRRRKRVMRWEELKGLLLREFRVKSRGSLHEQWLRRRQLTDKACARFYHFKLGLRIHTLVVKAGFDSDLFVQTSLVNFYAKYGVLEDALKLFDDMPDKNIVSWTAIICGFIGVEKCKEVVDVFRRLFGEMGQKDELSWTTMVTGYVKFGDLEGARGLLDGMDEVLPVTWNAMISGYVHHGRLRDALDLFRKMYMLGITQDEFTYTSVVSACADAGLFRHGKEVHGYILKTSVNPTEEFILSMNNALVTLYCKHGKVDAACEVFNRMPIKDLVSWNAILSGYVNATRLEEAKEYFRKMPEKNLLTWTVMISGLAQNGYGKEALKLFNQMRVEGFEPCDYALAGAISSCAVLRALVQGCQLHAQAVRFGHVSSLSVGNALITRYARCGSIEAANHAFLTMPYLDSISWNAMIAALGQHGHGLKSIEVFEDMLKEGILPDRITFLTVLSACNHAGLVAQGRRYFDSMYSCYGISPGEDHYGRLVDLLSRAGKFSEAMDVINSMPCKPGSCVWEALLASCRLHGNMDLGIEIAERLFEMKPQNDGTYILLSNMYASAGRWDDVAQVRKLMRDHGVKKEPGYSWIDVENQVNVFLVDDAQHPEVQSVYIYLEQLGVEMRKLGYVPDTNRKETRFPEFHLEDKVNVWERGNARNPHRVISHFHCSLFVIK